MGITCLDSPEITKIYPKKAKNIIPTGSIINLGKVNKKVPFPTSLLKNFHP